MAGVPLHSTTKGLLLSDVTYSLVATVDGYYPCRRGDTKKHYAETELLDSIKLETNLLGRVGDWLLKALHYRVGVVVGREQELGLSKKGPS